MKKHVMAFCLLAASVAVVNAQEFKIGMAGGIYSTWLVNTNVSDQGDDLDFAATFGGQLGVEAQYYFKDNLGLSFGLLFTGHNQKYTGDLGNNVSYDAKTKMRYLDIPILLRFGGGSKGAYFEFGPQIGMLMSAKDEFTTSPSSSGDWKDKDRKDNFKTSNIAGILGFGVDIDASENVLITTGLRLGYGFGDVTKEYTQAEAAALSATDNLGFSTGAAHIKQGDSGGDQFDYSPTARAFGGLHLGIIFKLPSRK
ncbi:MAG: PorT family protein [Bacteroidia bacterium]|nr:PorT family protein [Bacteroidia bacterium]